MVLKVIKRVMPASLKTAIRYCEKLIRGRKAKTDRKCKYWIDNDVIREAKFFRVPHRHCFMGYYDFEQVKGTNLVALSVKRFAKPTKDKADVICFDINTMEYKKIGETSAWCWQQGSRIKWHPNNSELLFFNDVFNGKYVSRIVNIKTGKCEKIINYPLYDISSDATFGIGLNFSRTERLRPGYGYLSLEDETKEELYPSTDGLWYISISSGKRKLLLSLYELSTNDQLNRDKFEHYINHVSISPDDKKILFLYIKKDIASERRTTSGYIYNLESGKYYSLGISGMSHYDWMDNNTIVYAAGIGKGRDGYFKVDIDSLERVQIGRNVLVEDGHPTCIGSGIITDTYPHKNQYQEMVLYNSHGGKRRVIGEFYHKPVYHHDKRCDLHPRISSNGKDVLLSCDTTCNGLREVFLGKLEV